MKKNDTQSHSISDRALKMIIRLSGLHHEFIAEKLHITPIYFWMIVNGRRKAPKKRQEIIDFVLEVKNFINKIAA